MIKIDNPFVFKARFIQPLPTTGLGTSNANPVAGRVYLQLFEVQAPQLVDAVIVRNNSPVAGNIRVGIYGPIVTEDTCLGSSLLVESADTVLSGASAPQIISITPTALTPGRYYVAIQFDNATHTYGWTGIGTVVIGWAQYYDRAGGYGAFTSPCPAITSSSSGPQCKLRMQV